MQTIHFFHLYINFIIYIYDIYLFILYLFTYRTGEHLLANDPSIAKHSNEGCRWNINTDDFPNTVISDDRLHVHVYVWISVLRWVAQKDKNVVGTFV